MMEGRKPFATQCKLPTLLQQFKEVLSDLNWQELQNFLGQTQRPTVSKITKAHSTPHKIKIVFSNYLDNLGRTDYQTRLWSFRVE